MLLVLLLLDEAEALIPAVLLCEFLEGCPVENRDVGTRPGHPPGSWTWIHTKIEGSSGNVRQERDGKSGMKEGETTPGLWTPGAACSERGLTLGFGNGLMVGRRLLNH